MLPNEGSQKASNKTDCESCYKDYHYLPRPLTIVLYAKVMQDYPIDKFLKFQIVRESLPRNV